MVIFGWEDIFHQKALMHDVNTEGFYACIQASLPTVRESPWQTRAIVICPSIYILLFRVI